jgi:hypothetical protein
MSLNPGQSLHASACSETRTAAEPIDEGDAVALNASGEVVPATDTDVVYGVAGDDHVSDGYAAGDDMAVVFSGPVVANVAAGVAPGVELTGSTTAGQLAAGSGAKTVVSKFAEGGGPEQIPDGFAHVDI